MYWSLVFAQIGEADAVTDIRPHIVSSRSGKLEGSDDDDDDDDDDDGLAEWSLRKCSAAALDVLSNVFGDEFSRAHGVTAPLLPILLPHMHASLSSTNWLERESGILALGAIAEGCCDGITPHLAQIVPFLLACSVDVKGLVR